MIQEIAEDQDLGEKEEGGWVRDSLQSWFEAGDGCNKNKAHSVIWASAHTKIYFLSFFPTLPCHLPFPTPHPCHHGIKKTVGWEIRQI